LSSDFSPTLSTTRTNGSQSYENFENRNSKKAPETFEELCRLFLPRPIHDEAENAEMIRVMDWIAVRAQNRDQFDYAKMLGDLVTEYEIAQRRRVKSKLSGLELLRAVIESSGLTQAELAKVLGVAQGTVSKIMTGARSITVDHAKRASRYFKMAPEAFLDLE
jgi:HTH-type transcriptional regulator / antitoxin HigA